MSLKAAPLLSGPDADLVILFLCIVLVLIGDGFKPNASSFYSYII